MRVLAAEAAQPISNIVYISESERVEKREINSINLIEEAEWLTFFSALRSICVCEFMAVSDWFHSVSVLQSSASGRPTLRNSAAMGVR